MRIVTLLICLSLMALAFATGVVSGVAMAGGHIGHEPVIRYPIPHPRPPHEP